MCLAIAAKDNDGDMCLLLASISDKPVMVLCGGNDLDGQGIRVPGGLRTHAEVARAEGHYGLAFQLTGEIRNNSGGARALRCRGPPPLASQRLFWRDDYRAHHRANEAYLAMRLEWHAHLQKCSRRARLELMVYRARPAIKVGIAGAAGLVQQPAVNLMLPAVAVLAVLTFVSDNVGGAWTTSVVQSAQGPQAERPMLALVACTLALQLTQEIEEIAARNFSSDTAAQMSRIRVLEQKAAGGACEWLFGYCAFLKDWLLWGGDDDCD